MWINFFERRKEGFFVRKELFSEYWCGDFVTEDAPAPSRKDQGPLSMPLVFLEPPVVTVNKTTIQFVGSTHRHRMKSITKERRDGRRKRSRVEVIYIHIQWCVRVCSGFPEQAPLTVFRKSLSRAVAVDYRIQRHMVRCEYVVPYPPCEPRSISPFSLSN